MSRRDEAIARWRKLKQREARKPWQRKPVKWAYRIPAVRPDRGAEARAWSRAVRERDGACRRCGAVMHLVAHHIKPWAKHPELRYDVTNGETLCRSCHRKEHPELPAHLFHAKP